MFLKCFKNQNDVVNSFAVAFTGSALGTGSTWASLCVRARRC